MTTIQQSYSRATYPRLAVLAGGLFVVGTNAFVIAGLLPDIAHGLGVSVSSVSYSITFYAIVVAVVAPAVSIGLPRVSRSHLMAAGLLLLAIGTFVTAASDSLTVFTIGRLVAAFGGAALVPAATAAAPAMVPASQHGKALAFVGLGFTLATAIGAPIGTALGAIGGWRLPLFALATLALVLTFAVLFFVRDVPLGKPATLRQRLAPLRDRRIVLVLGATLFMLVGFNIVYIFSSEVTQIATGGSGSLLAVLLLILGLGTVVGNVVSGPLTDRFGNRATGAAALAVEALALFALPFVVQSFVGTAIVFAILGAAGFAAVVPVQHRLATVDPDQAALALSWYSTAMYVGIALVPLLSAEALNLGGSQAIPLAGAIAVVLAVAVFLLGFPRRVAARLAA